MSILKVIYISGKPTDTCVCSYEAYRISVKNELETSKEFDYSLFIHPFADGMKLFERYKIYKYKDESVVKDNGFEYLIKYRDEVLIYYFDNTNIPKKIIELDSLLLESSLICPTAQLTD